MLRIGETAYYTTKENDIALTRGDTAPLVVNITTPEGEPYTMAADDTLKFTLKRHEEDEEALIQKTVTGVNTFTLEPADTKELAFGMYVYDIELTTASGDVMTVIPYSKFIVAKEVG